jgi:hypothetical protein
VDKYTIGSLIKYDPFFYIILGYFPNVDQQILKRISEKLWKLFIPHFAMLQRHRNEILAERPSDFLWKSCCVERDLFFVIAITCLFPVYCTSDLQQLYPTTLTYQNILEKAHKFLPHRSWQYFLFVLNDNQARL